MASRARPKRPTSYGSMPKLCTTRTPTTDSLTLWATSARFSWEEIAALRNRRPSRTIGQPSSGNASAVAIANNTGGTVLALMGGGVDGGAVTIPVFALTQNDGATIRAELPGVVGTVRLLERLGVHASGRALLYAPSPVAPGSSVSHWDVTATPDLLMEPFTSPDVFDQLDLTPAQFKDVGHTIIGADEVFADGFETGDTTAWSSASP